MCALASEARVPTFSIVVETANLETADAQRLLASLHSIATQNPAPDFARDVVLLDAGDAPPELLQLVRDQYPGVTIQTIPEGTDYGDQKALAARFASGDILLFADSDCLYEPGWIASMLESFAARPDVDFVAGETAVPITGPFTLAMAIIYFFPRFTYETELAPARGFYGNNVAFRRDLMTRVPFPAGLPIYRGQNVIYSRVLYEAGVPIWRQPRARSQHSPPENFIQAVRRLFWTGRDTPRLRIIDSAPASAPYQGDFEPYHRPGGRVRKVVERLRCIWRQQPRAFLLLPLAVPMAMACAASFFVGVGVERLRPTVKAASRQAAGLGRSAPGVSR